MLHAQGCTDKTHTHILYAPGEEEGKWYRQPCLSAGLLFINLKYRLHSESTDYFYEENEPKNECQTSPYTCCFIFHRKVTFKCFCSSKLSVFAQCLHGSFYISWLRQHMAFDMWMLIRTHVQYMQHLVCPKWQQLICIFLSFLCVLCCFSPRYKGHDICDALWYNSPCSIQYPDCCFSLSSVCSSMFSWPSWRVGGHPSRAQIWPAKRLEC